MAKVLVAGVAVLDFVFQVTEMPRTAEKYRADGASIVGGGNAANSAVAIARLGGNARLAARLGDDEIADLIVSGLRAEGVNTDAVRRFEGRRSSFSSIYVDREGERQIMNFRDMSITMDADWLAEIEHGEFGAALADTRWPQGAMAAMDLARTNGVPGIMDAEAPVRVAIDGIERASHVAFSAQGAAEFTGKMDVEEAALAASQMLDGVVLVTDGPNGTVRIEDSDAIWTPCPQVDAVDTLGAGDVWHGAFALQLAEGVTLDVAIRFANSAASLKCTRPGGRNGAPTRAETTAFMEQHT
ncbi:MAG: PfkB family carbohydrate kinase [Pseudomonadota bacterium]